MRKIEDVDKGLKNTPGSIVLCNHIMKGVFNLFLKEPIKDYNIRNWSFSCLMQLLESIVIHDQLFFWIPIISKGEETVGTNTIFENDNKAFKKMVFAADELKKISPLVNFLILPYKTEIKARVLTNKLDNYPFADSAISNEGVVNPEIYLKLSSIYGLSYKPAPWDAKPTDIFIENARNKYYASFASKTIDTISRISAEEIKDVNEWLHEKRYKIEIPLVFAYILNEHQAHRETITDTALRVREMKETVAFRKVCSEFDQAARIGDSNGINRIIREVRKEAENLNNRFQSPRLDIGLQIPPAISLSFNPLEVWNEFSSKRKRHLIFIGNLYKAAIQSEGLQKAFYKTRILSA